MRKLLLSFAAMMLAFVANAQVVFDFDNNYATYFPSLPGVSSGSNDTYVADGEFNEDAVVTVDGVTITIKASAADAKTRNRVWTSSPRLRLYNESFTIAAPSHKITSIEFDAHSSNFNVSTEKGELNSTTRQWVGSEDAVTFEVSKNTQIKTITVTLDKAVDVIPEVHIANAPEEPYDVTEAFKIIADGKALDEKVYVKGVISKINEIDTGNYGNATYFISNNGSEEGDQLEIYRGYSLKGEKFTSADEIKVGDVVVVYGKLTNYNGTYEFTTGSQIYSINGVTDNGGNDDEPAYELIGSGTETDPYYPTDVKALYGTESCPTDAVWVIGYIMGSAKSGSALNDEEQAASNIALGLSEDIWVPVQLPVGEVRDALNVVDNPQNIGKVAMVYGTIEKYFSVAGVKNVSAYYLDGADEEPDFASADATALTGTYKATVLLPEVAEVPGMGEWAAPGKVAEKNIQITGDAEGNVTVTGLTEQPLGAQYVYIEEEGDKYYYLIFAAESAIEAGEPAYAYVDGDFISVYYGVQTASETYYDVLCVRDGAALKDVTLYTATVEQMDAMGVLDIKPITTTCYVQDCGDYLTIYNLGGYSLLYGEKDAQGNIVLDMSQEWPYMLDFTSEDGRIAITANADGTYSYVAEMAYFGPNACISITLVPADANAIKSFAADSKKAEAVYNLQGQRLNAAHKGLVIKNGKKFMVK